MIRSRSQAFITQLIILAAAAAAVVVVGWIAVQVLGLGGRKGGTTANVRKAVLQRNHFHG
ncbi:hypothetical protein [Streptomyces sp. P9-A2]|uniref:hypothetical protein n=1 Tax=Streptomyces sp. P9-A2 TaxID=3072284 RepID=UPI002FC9ACFA